MTTDLDGARYIRFVSFRRDGSPVSTPVWLVPFEGGYAFTTDPESWKVRRIAGNPAVEVQVSNIRGRARRGAPVHAGRAELLDATATAAVRSAIRSKYRFMYWLLLERSDRKAARAEGSPTAGTAAIKIVLDR